MCLHVKVIGNGYDLRERNDTPVNCSILKEQMKEKGGQSGKESRNRTKMRKFQKMCVGSVSNTEKDKKKSFLFLVHKSALRQTPTAKICQFPMTQILDKIKSNF